MVLPRPLGSYVWATLILVTVLGSACAESINEPVEFQEAEPPSVRDSRSQVSARRIEVGEGGSEFLQTDSELVTVRPRDSIPAILDPIFATMQEAEVWMQPEELIIGVEIEGEAKAYPLAVMSWHEVANDVVGGQPVAVTW